VLYALYWATLKFREFVHGCNTIAFSNHESLTKLAKTIKVSRNGMIMSWLVEIIAMVRLVVHKSRKLIVIPDALSRVHRVHYVVEQTPVEGGRGGERKKGREGGR